VYGAPHLNSHGLAVLTIGFVVSFAVAYGVLARFMKCVRHPAFVPFAIYRLIVGNFVGNPGS
jgi:undecaprenyl-diphosphatase